MTLKMIGTAIGGAVGLVIAIVLVVFAWQIKGKLDDAQKVKDNADVVRLTGRVVELEASLAQRDSVAAQMAATFLTARQTFGRQPIVTGGGAKADAIANRAVQACFDTGAAALSACQTARFTADSVPILKDSLFTIEKRLIAGQRKRWTAHGGAFYSWPTGSPLVRVETQFRIINALSVVAGADRLLLGAQPDTAIERAMQRSPVKPWRAYTGVLIPFR